jgi:primosomal protein N' (replication factor Y)
VQTDAGLSLPDFSSAERTFQLIAQATGRVGRGADDSKVIIQSFQPTASAVQFGATQDYAGFYVHEIRNRQRGHFPPFSHLLKLTNSYKTEKSAVESARKLANVIANTTEQSSIKILGPTPAFYERVRDAYRWQIIVRATSRNELVRIAADIPFAHWQAELDPVSLI